MDNALHRHFRWRTNLLDPALLEDVKGVTAVLSDDDHFVPTQAVERHLNFEAPEVEREFWGCTLHDVLEVIF